MVPQRTHPRDFRRVKVTKLLAARDATLSQFPCDQLACPSRSASCHSVQPRHGLRSCHGPLSHGCKKPRPSSIACCHGSVASTVDSGCFPAVSFPKRPPSLGSFSNSRPRRLRSVVFLRHSRWLSAAIALRLPSARGSNLALRCQFGRQGAQPCTYTATPRAFSRLKSPCALCGGSVSAITSRDIQSRTLTSVTSVVPGRNRGIAVHGSW